MKVLILSDRPNKISETITAEGDEFVVSMAEPEVWPKDIDFIVSYGYRHKIKEPYLSQYQDRMLNLHISALPWNKGADPNFWSWFDDTPKGISAHLITAEFDTGPVIGQMFIDKWRKHETLSTSYQFLQECAERLFAFEWHNWRLGDWFYLPQIGPGSYHISKDKDPWMAKLPMGWDSPVDDVKRLGESHRGN